MRKIQNSIFLILFCSFSVFSQQNDFQNWTSLKLTKKIYKRTNICMKEGIRFRENSSLTKKLFTDFKLIHRIKKTNIEVSLGYRFAQDYQIDFTSFFKHRYYFDFSSNYKYNRFKISLRDRFQYQVYNSNFNTSFRQKMDISYNIRKNPLEPYIQFEYFFNLKENFEKLRYTAGFSYPIFRNVKTDFFYRLQKVLSTSNSEYLYVLGTSLSFKL